MSRTILTLSCRHPNFGSYQFWGNTRDAAISPIGGSHSGFCCTLDLEHNAELGITFRCSPTPRLYGSAAVARVC